MPSLYAFVGEYGPFKAKDFDPIENTLVWLCNSGETDDTDEGQPRRHTMYPLAGPIQDLLLRERDEDDPRFTTVLVVDIHDMFESHEDYTEALAKESEKADLTKKFGKKLLRLFQKLLLYKVAVAATGELCPLLLKLYQAVEKIDDTYSLEVNNTISELWLLHPQLPTKFVNNHLVVGENDVISSKKHPVQLNMVHSSSTSNKVSALKPFFPDIGTELVVDGDINDWLSVIAQRQDSEESPEPFCSTRCNNLGKKLFVSNVKVEMNRFSKQYERNCLEITSDLMTIFETKTNDEDGVDTIDWLNCEKHIGALLLRGNRCVLVRSISGEWEGMRVPSLVPNPNEAPHETAIRAVMEFADVDACEMRALPHVLPVAMYAPNGRPIMVELYPLYATSAPPSYGEGYENDESADTEDEDDPYDWYSFPKAITRLDKVSGMAIRSMALALMQASSVGLVPSKWGGVFGQEWQLQDALNGISAIA